VYALGTYPDTGKKVIHPMDFLKYGFFLWMLSLVITWVVGFLGIFHFVGFPKEVLETAKSVLDASMR
ncbi:MAG: hypothetical protein DRG83_09995, partial [Deltaproteobacteria bacterium]